jgi:abortive infection bacteriophage resistance protein
VSEKIFQTYRSQIRILRQRGLRVHNGGRAIKILEQENYYNLINGYKVPFLDPGQSDERFKAGADFNEIYALFLFDRAIRATFLKAILRIENHVKSVLAYEFSSKYKHDRYLRLTNFSIQTDNPKRLQRISQLIADVMGDIAFRVEKKHPAIEHYVQVHGYVPLWVLVNVLTLGRISTFYANMKLEDRQSVAKHFFMPENVLETYLRDSRCFAIAAPMMTGFTASVPPMGFRIVKSMRGLMFTRIRKVSICAGKRTCLRY